MFTFEITRAPDILTQILFVSGSAFSRVVGGTSSCVGEVVADDGWGINCIINSGGVAETVVNVFLLNPDNSEMAIRSGACWLLFAGRCTHHAEDRAVCAGGLAKDSYCELRKLNFESVLYCSTDAAIVLFSGQKQCVLWLGRRKQVTE